MVSGKGGGRYATARRRPRPAPDNERMQAPSNTRVARPPLAETDREKAVSATAIRWPERTGDHPIRPDPVRESSARRE
jgi:hypothetical protein